jgi:AraC family transcriptional regulator of adaptative response/methylated-DNA-[protein]-cysteine methyltransferase
VHQRNPPDAGLDQGETIALLAFEPAVAGQPAPVVRRAPAGVVSRMPGAVPLAFVSNIRTPIGDMVAAASTTHLLLLEFSHRRMLDGQLARVQHAVGCEFVHGPSPVFDLVRRQMDDYFRGERREFELPLLVPGTPFQTRVWDHLRRIPHGATTTYARVAQELGQPTAVRAVARANGDNRVAIIIPCHRVIGSDGSLTGYGGGLWRKKRLLELEAVGQALPLFDNL